MNLNEIQSAASLRAASLLDICYSDEQIEDFLAHRDAVGWCDALLALPPGDACWALAGLLQREERQLWADACARRAQDYAAAARRAHRAPTSLVDTARTAARAAAGAAARADATDAADATAHHASAAHHAAARAANAAYYAAATAARARAADAAYYAAATAARARAADAAYYTAAAEAIADARGVAARAAEYRTAIRHGAALLLGRVVGP